MLVHTRAGQAETSNSNEPLGLCCPFSRNHVLAGRLETREAAVWSRRSGWSLTWGVEDLSEDSHK